MDEWTVAAGSAIWLGLLTSISPCPLATNIVAMTYVGKQVDRPGHVALSGLLYTLGRTVSYVAVGMIVVAGLLAIPDVSFFLQRNMNKFLGPLLVLVGLFLLDILRFSLSGPSFADRVQGRVERMGLLGALLLGMLFALSFCPVSAALFFGSLIPLSLERQSTVVLPVLYGVGTALPVVAFALLLALGARHVGMLFDRLQVVSLWSRRITGAVFILIGLYLTTTYLLCVNVF